MNPETPGEPTYDLLGVETLSSLSAIRGMQEIRETLREPANFSILNLMESLEEFREFMRPDPAFIVELNQVAGLDTAPTVTVRKNIGKKRAPLVDWKKEGF